MTPHGARFRCLSASSNSSDGWDEDILYPLSTRHSGRVHCAYQHAMRSTRGVRKGGSERVARGMPRAGACAIRVAARRKFLTVRDLRQYRLTRTHVGVSSHQDGRFPKCGPTRHV
ncbi:hypothetical protein GCM10010252_69880 [Streptomyces aureoverticillatus]|nr:hypothetical protein GCM10010252_69880 [Streptomyces aureoverticillatus]